MCGFDNFFVFGKQHVEWSFQCQCALSCRCHREKIVFFWEPGVLGLHMTNNNQRPAAGLDFKYLCHINTWRFFQGVIGVESTLTIIWLVLSNFVST